MPVAQDFKIIIDGFIDSLTPESRDASYDYCYNYFHNNRGDELTKDMEKSCLVLGFYLASWGMLRGSSFLLQRSIKHFEPVIGYLATLDNSFLDIDVDNYTENTGRIIKLYSDLENHLSVFREISADNKTPSVILVTKVMLGVFGIIPAYDTNFVKIFSHIEFTTGKCSFARVDKESLDCLTEFYEANKGFIDDTAQSTTTLDFSTGVKTKINYTKAKIIDMYGWQKGK